MNKKIFKVSFKIRVYCKGIYMFTDAHITIPADNEIEAKQFVLENTELSVVDMNVKVKDVTPFK